jgi:hypothetical protein
MVQPTDHIEWMDPSIHTKSPWYCYVFNYVQNIIDLDINIYNVSQTQFMQNTMVNPYDPYHRSFTGGFEESGQLQSPAEVSKWSQLSQMSTFARLRDQKLDLGWFWAMIAIISWFWTRRAAMEFNTLFQVSWSLLFWAFWIVFSSLV